MREREYLKNRYAAILSSVGLVLVLAGLVMLTPLLALAAFPAEKIFLMAFALPSAMLLLLGLGLRQLCHPAAGTTLSIEEGGIIVLLSWVLVILFSAWPFIAILDIPFSLALFETVSGWTTTGLSVIDLRSAGHLILLWRSIIQLAGGAGLAIIMMSAIIGPTGIGILSAEGRNDQLVPQVRQSARLVLIIYCAYALAGIAGYRWAGMTTFDAINHAFAAVSTGGFSTRAESIGAYHRIAVEAVSLPLMVLGNLSFVTAWLLWRGKLRAVAGNGEIRLQLLLIPLSCAALLLFTCAKLYPGLGPSLRVAVFQVVSALTTTGFSTVDYHAWNGFGILLLVTLMLIGGGTCSTAGGIKQFRIYLLAKMIYWDIRRTLLPRDAILERPIRMGDRQVFVDDARIHRVAVFVFLYLATYLLGVLLLSACGYSLGDALFEFASAIGTVGLSVGVTSAHMPAAALWSEIFAMFLGRLEFVVVIVSCIKLASDVKHMLVGTAAQG